MSYLPSLSKSKFVSGVQCEKKLWLSKHQPEEAHWGQAQEAVFASGTSVGELATQLFPGGTDARPENMRDFKSWIKESAECLENGVEVIYEAAFSVPGAFEEWRAGVDWPLCGRTAGYVERFYSITCALVEAYFAPTSQSRMSKNFRDLESLGKSNMKKWSQNWTFLLGSGLKSPHKKKVFFCWFCITKHGENHTSWWIRDISSKGLSLILAYL